MAENIEDKSPQISDEMPVVPHRILYAGLPIFDDEACTQEAPGGTMVILEPLDPSDDLHELDILPTSLEYTAGQLTHFQTNQHKMFDAAWFNNPITGQVERTCRVAFAEFVGAVISDETVAKNREVVQELERQLSERHSRPQPAPMRVN